MTKSITWNTKEIIDAITRGELLDTRFSSDSIKLNLFENNFPIGVGVNKNKNAILILPGQNNVTAFKTKYAEFDPWTNLTGKYSGQILTKVLQF
jgi:hypothetical protein